MSSAAPTGYVKVSAYTMPATNKHAVSSYNRKKPTTKSKPTAPAPPKRPANSAPDSSATLGKRQRT